MGGVASSDEVTIDAILEGIGEGFFALDADWRFTIFNPAAEKIFGLRKFDVIGRRLWDVSPGTVGSEFERRYNVVMSQRVRQEFEYHSALRPDSYHEIRAFPLGAGIGVAFRDITHRRKSTEALLARERELIRFQQIGGMGGMQIDLRAELRSRRSPEYLALHGLPPGSEIETHADWVKRVHPDDRAKAEQSFFRALASRDSEYKGEYRIIRPSDGAVRWIRATAVIERDENGEPVALVGAHLDITDRRQAEDAARESEERLRATTDALPFLIAYVDKDQYFRFANKPYEVWFERNLSEIVGRKLSEVLDPESYEVRRPFVERALAGETLTYEAEYRRRDEVAVSEITHLPHRDAAGRVIGMYALVQDITARKRSERSVAESEQRFRSIADSAPVPIWVSKLNGLREFVNRAYVDFLGVSFDEALNFDWRRALHPGDLDRILVEQHAGESSRRPFALEARYRGPGGNWRWLRSESQPRWGPDGEHVGFIGVAHDITSAKDAEQNLMRINEILEQRVQERSLQLAATEALISTFFRHSSECHAVIVESDRETFRFEEVNPALLELYGRTRSEVIGSSLEEVHGVAGGAIVAAHLRACLRTGAPYRYERTQADAIVEAIATPVPGESGGPRRVVVSARDVTAQRRLEQQLRQSQKMEAVGQLTGGVAHDFNNLLTLVVGGLDTIGRVLPNLGAPGAAERIERARDMALQGAKRAAALTSRLLAFSRKQNLSPQVVDANALVASVCELLRRTLGESISIACVTTEGIWPVYADPNQLENALLNLALNARDAMPNGGVLTLETANAQLEESYVEALAETLQAGPYVMIAVTDTGAGMDAVTRERAFDPFFTTKEVGKGTGLGLSQVLGFARQSAGHVKIYSEVGEGSSIKIYLPMFDGDKDGVTAPVKVASSKLVARAKPGEQILVVEDDDALREHTTDVLRELGYRVCPADGVKSALHELEARADIDLLFTDIVMPGGLDGRELAKLALSQKPSLKVLFMTGYARNATLNDGRLGSGARVIGKPFSFEQIASKIRETLDESA